MSDTATIAPRSPASALPSDNPFQRLAAVLEGIAPGADPIVMTIGEPRHPIPGFTGEVLQAHLAEFSRYPAITGTEDFRAAAGAWLDARYRLGGALPASMGVVALNGSREGLTFAALGARDYFAKTDERQAVLMPNPFYQTYAAAAHVAGAEAVYLDAGPQTGFLPDLDQLDPALLDRTVAFFLASPANPQGAAVDLEMWCKLIELARRHRFLLIADECYSEIYRDTPPPGVLEAALALGEGFANVLSINSLSKRSNLAGLRCGIAAGDPAFLAAWTRFRGLCAPQVSMPLQAVAAAAYRDEAHVEENRRLYNEKFAIAERELAPLFGPVTPAGGFFLWLDVSRWGGGVAVSRRLWAEAGVKVLPGAFLSMDRPGGNPGEAYIRLALVDDAATVEAGLACVLAVLGD
ncbi:aminotransferase class I/II-fold pyridoxal phosphate-dependent enzyme [Stappia indica]|uniref:aminotransferase class I/II-fold pyridoxal phosphate-dependent enzyme n=1 Tax=Stappia indica TaxID=538381 RepID=UPI001CD2009D|nr:aminotransferase class I/II-fold pyridoxal phosphate-dependent enzyme [Stappia indica]MCA1299709.1 aminotransferase class I/II-fold pyridoxal phosphate-dependent enzyme [Stappia indica]